MRHWAILALIASLAGCQTPPQASAVQRAPLDTALAAPCRVPDAPLATADYDATDDWLIGAVLPALADCARRHAAVVRAWQQ